MFPANRCAALHDRVAAARRWASAVMLQTPRLQPRAPWLPCADRGAQRRRAVRSTLRPPRECCSRAISMTNALFGIAFFQLVATRDPVYIVFAHIGGLALSQASLYAVQSTWFAELFGTRVRYTGASLPCQIAGIITSGPAPLISTWLFATYHQPLPIAGYIAVTAVISLLSAYFPA